MVLTKTPRKMLYENFNKLGSLQKTIIIQLPQNVKLDHSNEELKEIL